MNQKKALTAFGYSRYSQYGEDGIVETIFSRIGSTSRLCVEFGAWDGFHYSNVANLWTQGWRGVLIECDGAKFADLQRNTAGHNCTCIRAMVGYGEEDSIEAILRRNGLSGEPIDLLSVDIDGDDYYVFESLRNLKPRVVIVEYNPTIPVSVDLHAAKGSFFGCSVASLVRLGRERGYHLVSLTDTNAFFVTESETPKLSEFDTSIETIRVDKHLVYLSTSFAGDYVLCGRPLFRLSLPYRGELFGEFRRVVFKPRILRLARVLGKLRRAWKARWP